MQLELCSIVVARAQGHCSEKIFSESVRIHKDIKNCIRIRDCVRKMLAEAYPLSEHIHVRTSKVQVFAKKAISLQLL